MIVLQTAVLGLGCALFLAMCWSVRFHFRPFVITARMLWIGVPSVGGAVLFARRLWTQPIPEWRLWLAAVHILVAAVLFVWAIMASRHARPRLAFDATAPEKLMLQGPYAFVRHPFYLAYTIYWTGCAIATLHVGSFGVLLILFVAFVTAARGEEELIARSNLAAEYAAYRRSAGFMWPRLTRRT